MNTTVTTNEWLDASIYRAPVNRPLLVLSAYGQIHAAVWTGYYWSDYNTHRAMRLVITHFYIFERPPYGFGR